MKENHELDLTVSTGGAATAGVKMFGELKTQKGNQPKEQVVSSSSSLCFSAPYRQNPLASHLAKDQHGFQGHHTRSEFGSESKQLNNWHRVRQPRGPSLLGQQSGTPGR